MKTGSGDMGFFILDSLLWQEMETSPNKIFLKGISETLFVCLSPNELIRLWTVPGLCPISGQVSPLNDGKSFGETQTGGQTLILLLLGCVTLGGSLYLCKPQFLVCTMGADTDLIQCDTCQVLSMVLAMDSPWVIRSWILGNMTSFSFYLLVG